MSNTKTVMGQASNQYVVPLDITDVFSTYLYTGTGAVHTITNGIDLDGEGGLVWAKIRDTASTNHMLVDTERGVSKAARTNFSSAEQTGTFLDSFNSNGFTLANNFDMNGSGYDIASWTFRKAPKFFDVVTWTGDGVAGRTVSHNLGSTPGMIIVKRTNDTGHWYVYHRSTGSTGHLVLNLTDSFTTFSGGWNDTNPTDTEFTLGNSGYVNASGDTYVAYLFAHNDGDGGFGPDGDQDIIKCGSYTGNNGQPHHVELGFEPQWLLVKNADLNTGGTWWSVVDIMRGMADTSIKLLKANTSDAEINENAFTPTATGFTVTNNNDFQNNSTNKYIYIAIRRGPLAPPESATEVFNVHKETTATLNQSPKFLQPSGFPVDFVSNKLLNSSSSWWSATRLTNARLQLESTAAETSVASTHEFDHMDGVAVAGLSGSTNFVGYHWKRAPNFFDVVAYSGNSTAGNTVSHNLGVAPEMIWVKKRNVPRSWKIYNAATGSGKAFEFDTATAASSVAFWNNTDPTGSAFTLGSSETVNGTGDTYIAYLFASLPGISKVGSYSGDGTTDGSKVIDCGFTSGARFVLIKTSNTAGDWMVYDTVRGIVAGNDPVLSLNNTAAEATTYDNLIPNSSGFAVIQNTDGAYTTNESGHEYIFYAIA